jgi:ATP/maltotriose-dependent transcriptional regulator MalT
MKDFLLRSALLPSMTTAMAQQVSGNSNAAALLDSLYRQRLFTDRRGEEYQFHDLFRAFLLEQFGHVYTVVEHKDMRRKSGLLLEETQQFDKAFSLYCDAQDWESVVRLILGQARGLLTQGRGETVREWIRSLPAGMADPNPWIDYWLGMSLIAIDPSGRGCRWSVHSTSLRGSRIPSARCFRPRPWSWPITTNMLISGPSTYGRKESHG